MQQVIERTSELPLTEADLRRHSEARWVTLPKVLKATFELTRKLSLNQTLETLGVSRASSRIGECAYETGSGRLVVTVWHDRIRREADGSLTYRFHGIASATVGSSPAAQRARHVRELLERRLDQEVYVVLLKRSWDASGAAKAERNAADFRAWRVESAGPGGIVLRREMAGSA